MSWSKTTLGEFAPLFYGKGLPQAKRNSGRIPVYGSNGIVGSHNIPFVEQPAVIIGRKGSVGEVHLATGPCWPIDTAFFVKGSKKADLYFLYYLLKTLPITSNSDSAVPGLSRDYAHSIEIEVPSMDFQIAIGQALHVLDSKIAINNALSKTLEDIAQTIFKSWFIDFDPVKVKMNGEKPIGMDDETAALFPDSFEESELGLIPKGWKVHSLDEISDYLNGLAMQKFPATDDDIKLPVIKIAQLRAGNSSGADMASGQIDSRFVIQDGDILFSWSGTLEVETWAGGPGALNQHLFKVTGKTVPNWFSYLSTKHYLPLFRQIAKSKATTMGHIQRSHLSESKFAVPSTELLNLASPFLEPMIKLKINSLVENRTLVEIRDSLLPRLISGDLQIPEEMLAS